MEHYKKEIADHPKVEMIHVSLDFNQKAATKWARAEGFTWPTVMMKQIGEAGFEPLTPQEAPNYKLIDQSGKIVVEGKEAVLEKIAALGKKS